MSNYYYIDDKDYEKIVKALKMQKHLHSEYLVDSLNYQFKKYKNQNPKYRLAAKNLLNKLDSKLISTDSLMIDEDALISENNNGAYVHCWVWVDSDTKNKRIRKANK